MVNELSSNGKEIKIVKDPHLRILKLKSLRLPHAERNRINDKIRELRSCPEVYQWDYFKSEMYHLYALFFTLEPITSKEVKITETLLLQVTRRVFYKISILVEVLLGESIAKMLEDGFFFKPLTKADPAYLHQLFEVVDVIYTRKIKI